MILKGFHEGKMQDQNMEQKKILIFSARNKLQVSIFSRSMYFYLDFIQSSCSYNINKVSQQDP